MNRLQALADPAGSAVLDAATPGTPARGAKPGWRTRWLRTLAAGISAWAGATRGRRVGEDIMASKAVPSLPVPVPAPGAHPNELDLRRIRRALAGRRRYRYVEPRVLGTAGGYRVESPCCSRNVDPRGGVIDIARLEPVPGSGQWLLQRRDHQRQIWVAHGVFAGLAAALAVLGEDPDRLFWP